MATHEDDRFFKGIDEQMEGYFPGLSEKIDELNHQQFGRGIVIGKNRKLAGYVLPLQEDQYRHLIIFKSGTMFVIQPQDETSTFKDIYTKEFSPSEQPITYLWDSIQLTERHILEGGTSKTVLQNNSLENLPQIKEAINQAVSLAEELKAKRIQARDESAKLFLEKIDTFLNPPKKPTEEDSLPPTHPQDPPKPEEPPQTNKPSF